MNQHLKIIFSLLYWTAGADNKDIFFDKDIYDRDYAVLEELNKPVVYKKLKDSE